MKEDFRHGFSRMTRIRRKSFLSASSAKIRGGAIGFRRNMVVARIAVLFFIAFVSTAFSQGTRPVLVDELRTGGSNCEEGFALLDNFFNELNNNPSADGVIVLYNDAVDVKAANRREKQLRNHIQLRKFDRSRITFIRGEERNNGTTQFWLIQPGAERPDVSGGMVSTGATVSTAAEPYFYATEYGDGIPGCVGNLYDLEEFARVLQSDPKSTARVVISQSSQARYRKKVGEIVSELGGHGIKRTRIVTVYKYVRPNRVLESSELWVVPSKLKADSARTN